MTAAAVSLEELVLGFFKENGENGGKINPPVGWLLESFYEYLGIYIKIQDPGSALAFSPLAIKDGVGR